MGLVVFNTLGNRKQGFVPLREGEVRMYVCGITAYDHCHLGHARANMVFDFIFRYLSYLGYRVTYVRNFTDIDDKIITRAREENVDFTVISERYIEAFKEDMTRLGILNPTHEPRATEHIPEIVSMVEDLIEKGYAYEVSGDVYCSVDKISGYGKLSGKNVQELVAGARVEVDERKKNPLDFALWKKSKPGEPSWDSPWGEGRPGWHIECSAMSMRHLGESFDIHGGGKDLIFPHHENEIAQSEASTGDSFVNYWIHNGFVNIDKEKMSKSLGNYFTIREVLEDFHPEVIRFFFASNHYRSPIDFSDESIREAKAGLDRLYNFFDRHNRLVRAGIAEVDEMRAAESLEETERALLLNLSEKFVEAMNDDFNTAAAVGYIFDAVRRLNRIFPSDITIEREKASAFVSFGGKIIRLTMTLGLLSDTSDAYFRYGIEEKLKKKGISIDTVLDRIREREEARALRNYERSDRIRDELTEWGMIVEDTRFGTFWKFADDDM